LPLVSIRHLSSPVNRIGVRFVSDPGLPLPRHGTVRGRRPGELHRAERQGGGARGQRFHETNR
jgi:hypothetical protein